MTSNTPNSSNNPSIAKRAFTKPIRLLTGGRVHGILAAGTTNLLAAGVIATGAIKGPDMVDAYLSDTITHTQDSHTLIDTSTISESGFSRLYTSPTTDLYNETIRNNTGDSQELLQIRDKISSLMSQEDNTPGIEDAWRDVYSQLKHQSTQINATINPVDTDTIYPSSILDGELTEDELEKMGEKISSELLTRLKAELQNNTSTLGAISFDDVEEKNDFIEDLISNIENQNGESFMQNSYIHTFLGTKAIDNIVHGEYGAAVGRTALAASGLHIIPGVSALGLLPPLLISFAIFGLGDKFRNRERDDKNTQSNNLSKTKGLEMIDGLSIYLRDLQNIAKNITEEVTLEEAIENTYAQIRGPLSDLSIENEKFKKDILKNHLDQLKNEQENVQQFWENIGDSSPYLNTNNTNTLKRRGAIKQYFLGSSTIQLMEERIAQLTKMVENGEMKNRDYLVQELAKVQYGTAPIQQLTRGNIVTAINISKVLIPVAGVMEISTNTRQWIRRRKIHGGIQTHLSSDQTQDMETILGKNNISSQSYDFVEKNGNTQNMQSETHRLHEQDAQRFSEMHARYIEFAKIENLIAMQEEEGSLKKLLTKSKKDKTYLDDNDRAYMDSVDTVTPQMGAAVTKTGKAATDEMKTELKNEEDLNKKLREIPEKYSDIRSDINTIYLKKSSDITDYKNYLLAVIRSELIAINLIRGKQNIINISIPDTANTGILTSRLKSILNAIEVTK